MADPRAPRPPALAPGMVSLCQDAQRLGATYPAPALEKSGSWHPAPWSISSEVRALCGGAPDYIN
ncbi:MAG TPA: hypothetical protein VMZ00_18410 [Sporichthya sp.]|nr:hypothetical protein [Sporichthya sp.]